jgi:alpha-N-acetylglucosamine transferase
MQRSIMLMAAALLQAGLSSALTFSNSHLSKFDESQGYAYVTMSMAHKYMPKHALQNTMTEKQIEDEGPKIFDAERAFHEIKKQKDFMLKDAKRQEEALDEPGRQVSRLAQQLLGVDSKYKLVVLTNDMALMNVSASELPENVILQPIDEYLHRSCAMAGKNIMHFQKLNVFGLTQYKKLMWLDWDLEIKKNIDDLFEKDTADGKIIYGQPDDWQCLGRLGSQSASGGFCSAMMLFTPVKSIVSDLVNLSFEQKSCWGDQVLIANHFGSEAAKAQGREWRLWDKNTIRYSRCAHGKKDLRVVHHADLPAMPKPKPAIAKLLPGLKKH